MKKIISNYLENVNGIEWENGKTEISLKCCDESEKEIGEVLVDDEAITYRFKNLEGDTYSVRRYLREILKNRRTERDNEKIYIDGTGSCSVNVRGKNALHTATLKMRLSSLTS